jgi:hypothetical protein
MERDFLNAPCQGRIVTPTIAALEAGWQLKFSGGTGLTVNSSALDWLGIGLEVLPPCFHVSSNNVI